MNALCMPYGSAAPTRTLHPKVSIHVGNDNTSPKFGKAVKPGRNGNFISSAWSNSNYIVEEKMSYTKTSSTDNRSGHSVLSPAGTDTKVTVVAHWVEYLEGRIESTMYSGRNEKVAPGAHGAPPTVVEVPGMSPCC